MEPNPPTREVTRLLGECREGSADALVKLLPLVYDELRALAESQLRREREGHTLQATALVHEAYMRLVEQREQSWSGRAHFFGVAATAMRRVLVNHAIARRAQKRGSGQEAVELDEALAVFEERSVDLVALDEALDALAKQDAEKARIVELRFFAGLSTEEAAQVLGVSTRTVERGWRTARAWLRTRLG